MSGFMTLKYTNSEYVRKCFHGNEAINSQNVLVQWTHVLFVVVFVEI